MNPTVIVVIVIGFVVAIVAMFSSWAALLKTVIPRGTARGRR